MLQQLSEKGQAGCLSEGGVVSNLARVTPKSRAFQNELFPLKKNAFLTKRILVSDFNVLNP